MSSVMRQRVTPDQRNPNELTARYAMFASGAATQSSRSITTGAASVFSGNGEHIRTFDFDGCAPAGACTSDGSFMRRER